MDAFKEELIKLINKYSIENKANMPDYVMGEMLCNMIEVIGSCTKQTLQWHGCCSPHQSEGNCSQTHNSLQEHQSHLQNYKKWTIKSK
jgi:hypothetical protein